MSNINPNQIKKLKSLKQAEKHLESSMSESVFYNMARTLTRKKAYRSKKKLLQEVLNKVKKEFKSRNSTKKFNLDENYLNNYFDSKDGIDSWKISNSSNEFVAKAFINGAIQTWRYKIAKSKLGGYKLIFWYIVTSSIPISYTSLAAARQRLLVNKIFVRNKIYLKESIKTKKRDK